MMFAAMPLPRINKKRVGKFVEPVIPAGGFVLGHVGTYKECFKWIGQTMQDWTSTKEVMGISTSPAFLWAMNMALGMFDHLSYENRILFGYPHDVVNQDIDIIWVKIHFTDKVEGLSK